METKPGLMTGGDNLSLTDDNSDHKHEDRKVHDLFCPAIPSPSTLKKPLRPLEGLGVTKVSCFVLNFFPRCFFSTYILLILIMKRILGRNGSPQDHKRTQSNNNREKSTGLRFIKVGGSKQFLGMPLWK